ncbi:Ulp1 family isopeptidase [Mesorhizobium jarvisii]|uniref:Ulp1 family isopeptidase n=2 Tax=Mesorhizobium TaxID=68287 RepID=UPI001F0A7AAD|nr:C48 family peptidase [Mesorhizobium jarvisii]
MVTQDGDTAEASPAKRVKLEAEEVLPEEALFELDQSRSAFGRALPLGDLTGDPDRPQWQLFLADDDAVILQHAMEPCPPMDNVIPFRDPQSSQSPHPDYADPEHPDKCSPRVKVEKVTFPRGFRQELQHHLGSDAKKAEDRLRTAVQVELERQIKGTLLANPPYTVRRLTAADVQPHEQKLAGQYGLFLAQDLPTVPTLRNGQILGLYSGVQLVSEGDLKQHLAKYQEREVERYQMTISRGGVEYQLSPLGGANSMAFANTALKAGMTEPAYDFDRINAIFFPFHVDMADREGRSKKEAVMAVVALDNVRPGGEIRVDYSDGYLGQFKKADKPAPSPSIPPPLLPIKEEDGGPLPSTSEQSPDDKAAPDGMDVDRPSAAASGGSRASSLLRWGSTAQRSRARAVEDARAAGNLRWGSTAQRSRAASGGSRASSLGPGRAALATQDPTDMDQPGQASGLAIAQLGPTAWLYDEHIHADYNRLALDLSQTDPGFAAQTRFVPPAVVHMLLHTEGEVLQDTLRGLYVTDAGQEARFLFLPVNNANGANDDGTHWSLLFVDRSPEGQQAIHYNSLTDPAQDLIACNLARKLGEEIRYQQGLMAPQDNGYDCGVLVLEATRELATRLANSQPPEAASLDLRSVLADRSALRARHGAQPAIAFPSDEKMDEGPDLAKIAEATPRLPGQRKVVWADALKAADADLGAADAALIVRATRRAAFKAVSVQDQERLNEIAKATPQQPEQSKGGWADALKAAHPDLSAADAALIVRATKREIARRAPFKAVSVQDQERLNEIAKATPPQPEQTKGGWADALKAAHPDLSAADAALIVRATKREIANRAPFQAVSVQDQERLDDIAEATPRQPEQTKGGWADALKAAHPDLSAADAALIVRATKGEIARRAPFKAVSVQDQERLNEIAKATPQQQGQTKGDWADALKAAHPDLSAADAAIIVRATKGDIARRAAFKAVSVQDQERLNEIAKATPRQQRQSKVDWADALKAAHPDLSAADAALIVRASRGEITRRAAFKAVSVQDQERLNEIAKATPRQPEQSKGGWADALKAAHPDLSAADAALIVRATKGEIANRAAFKAVSVQDQERLDDIAEATPRQPSGRTR